MTRQCAIQVAAKVNLSLNITGRADGYHLLDSVFASVDLYDTVTVCRRGDDTVSVRFSDAKIGAGNRVGAAVAVLKSRFGPFGADITVENRIPAGGGLGGSSADAAGAIRALNALFGFTDDPAVLYEAAAAVGSDVPFMLDGGLARVTGRGEKLAYFAGRTDIVMYLVVPPSPVSTPACFAAFDRRGDAGTAADIDRVVAALRSGEDFAPYAGNALYPAAVSLNPQVRTAYDAIAAAGGRPVMTGSGSACIGLFRRLPENLPGTEGFFVRRIVLADGIRFAEMS